MDVVEEEEQKDLSRGEDPVFSFKVGGDYQS
jgi:hypothetical protein